jgi:hypothetical protein
MDRDCDKHGREGNAYSVLVENLERNTPLGIHLYVEDNI